MNPVDALIKAVGSSTIPLVTPSFYGPVLADGNGVLYTRLVSGVTPIDPDQVVLTSDAIAITNGIATGSANLGYNGATWDRVRAASVFKSAAVTASGNTAVWTPAAGKKFRLLAWRLSVAGTLAADGTQIIQLRDGTTTVIARAGANVAAALPANDSQIGEDYGLKGQLSAAANNVLNLNLGTAMATGAVYIDAWGTEE